MSTRIMMYLYRALVMLLAIPCHEAAHAWVSLKLGDSTGRDHGRLTLNQCGRLTGMNRRVLCKLLADFIRFGLVGQEFADHRFYFQLSHTEQLNDYGTDQPIHRQRE